MSDPVHRLTPLADAQIISLDGTSDEQAGLKIRALFHKHPAQHPQELDFTMPLRAIASFPGSRNLDTEQDSRRCPAYGTRSGRPGASS